MEAGEVAFNVLVGATLYEWHFEREKYSALPMPMSRSRHAGELISLLRVARGRDSPPRDSPVRADGFPLADTKIKGRADPTPPFLTPPPPGGVGSVPFPWPFGRHPLDTPSPTLFAGKEN